MNAIKAGAIILHYNITGEIPRDLVSEKEYEELINNPKKMNEWGCGRVEKKGK